MGILEYKKGDISIRFVDYRFFSDYVRAIQYTLVHNHSVHMGLQWVILNASDATDPLKAHQTDFRSWMGNRITPSNTSE